MVPNSVDTQIFHAPKSSRGSPPTIGLMYPRDVYKGIEVALAAIKVACHRRPDIRVVAFGTSFPSQDATLPAGSLFFHRPEQPRLREIYVMCDLFLMASYDEGFSILEDMACRCPVVSTRTGCAAYVIADGWKGFVVDVGDADGLGGRLADILDLNFEDWSHMSAAAVELALKCSWDDAARLFERACFDLLPTLRKRA